MIKYLCLSGGGIKGISFVGALKVLEEKNIIQNITSIAGCSVGGLVASLITLGYTSDELYQLTLNIDFAKLQNLDIFGLINNFGLDSGKGFVNLFKILIEKKVNNSNITLLQLYEKTNIELILISCCLNTGESIIYNFKTHPNVKLFDAIRISISIPILFTSPKYQNMNYVDGGLVNDFPLELYNDKPKDEVLGIRLDEKYLDFFNERPINDIESYLICLFYCILKKIKKDDNVYSKPYQIIQIDIDAVSPIQFNLNLEEKVKMYNDGYKSTSLFFTKKDICNKIKNYLLK
jgi:NTE family protein